MIRGIATHPIRSWAGGYLRHLVRKAGVERVRGPRHVMFALCDHYEPLWAHATEQTGLARVKAWTQGYPSMAGEFADADGRHPQHSFFFPAEQYRPELIEELGKLVEGGWGEIEVHLHHEHDTAQRVGDAIETFVGQLGSHGHLARDHTGRLRYAFIHGNWALANGHPTGIGCGVDEELPILFQTGCYADFTFPAAPDPCQPKIVNEIYWPTGNLARRRAYEHGVPARVGERYNDRILLVQGPLAPSLRPRSWRPRIEYSALTAADPATASRLSTWLAAGIHVRGRPDWVFVKVHTHGAPEHHARSLLGAPTRHFHEAVARLCEHGDPWVLHYVTAREMFNIAAAAMDGRQGDPGRYRDYELAPPPARTRDRFQPCPPSRVESPVRSRDVDGVACHQHEVRLGIRA